jgi:hypothetical protein
MTQPAGQYVRNWQLIINELAPKGDGALGANLSTGTAADGLLGIRGLTPAEIAVARSVFGDKIDLSRILVAEHNDFDKIARTVPVPPGGTLIEFPRGTLTAPPPGYEGWLIHELTHAWQYQRGDSLLLTVLPNAIAGQYYYGTEPEPATEAEKKKAEDQGLREAKDAGKPFIGFTTEQQGDILRDYHDRVQNHKDTSAYDPYVNSVRNGTPNVGMGTPLPPDTRFPVPGGPI